MPRPEDYIELPSAVLRERLARAEAACILFGWSTGWPDRGGEAIHQAWDEWVQLVGSDFLTPARHPDLDERRIHELVQDRRAIRDRTMGRIREAGLAPPDGDDNA